MNPPRFFLQILLRIPWSRSATGLNMAIYFHPVHCIHPSMWVTAGLHACRPPCQANHFQPAINLCDLLQFAFKYKPISPPIRYQALWQPGQNIPIPVGLGITWDRGVTQNRKIVGDRVGVSHLHGSFFGYRLHFVTVNRALMRT
ncbi:hypothetical protein DPMN_106963 [Dreissena polymorpha]|uniref:Uncharacterized protein n=1 Tax=Dreissena polymorpha TaxID=45954 RepID=A0A9D4K616_DREPO|nr:hypothetical protein DPMN_106963 [Dreissena polymorpha]